MAFVTSNPNPKGSYVGDCVVRALSIALNKKWRDVYMDLAIEGLTICDMPSSNQVWGEYLKSQGFQREYIPNTCPDCYTIRQFCNDNPKGLYILATGTHVVCAIDGNYFDTWDCGDEPIIYFWKKGSNE